MEKDRQRFIFGGFLYFFAFYTLVIKYFMPIGWALTEKVAIDSYIYFWDAWWIFHLFVGYGLIRKIRFIWTWAVLLSVAEIVIIAVKLTLYWLDPNPNFWFVQWMVNKSLMIVYFVILLIWLVHPSTREDLK